MYSVMENVPVWFDCISYLTADISVSHRDRQSFCSYC